MKKTLGAVAAAAAIALSLSACGGSAPASSEAKGEINYWLWDANQLPGYQQCADDFTKANPDIKVKVTQRGWDDYWTTLTNGFVAGTAPDVFTNHLSKYPEYAAKKQLLSLDDAVAKDGIKLENYTKGLPELWVGQDGKRYGLPKDWDTVGLGVFKSQSPQGAPDWSGLMAATLIAALPVLLLFIAFGKRVVNSIGFSGIK